MITGFNTDIEYQGVTYHVQTEDKGLETPLILSLVYHRGTILASKRSPYDDLLNDFDEKILVERLQKQHKLICAAIRGGRIEDLKRMTMKESSRKKKGLVVETETKPVSPEKPLGTIEEKPDIKEEIPAPQILNPPDNAADKLKPPEIPSPSETRLSFDFEPDVAIPKPKEAIWNAPISISDDDLIFDEENVEEVMILPAEAVEIITDFAKHEEPAADTLSIELLTETIFKAGETKTISVLVSRGRNQKNLGSVSVMVKILGAAFRPLIFHAKTDSNGVAVIPIQIPQFSRGRAAVLIKASSDGDEVEVRRVIQSR